MQCYKCGCLLPPGHVVRRNITVGSSYHSRGGVSHHTADVSLCRRCASDEDYSEAQRNKVLLTVFLILGGLFFIGVITVMGLILFFSLRAR